MNRKWNERSVAEKAADIITIIVFCVLMVSWIIEWKTDSRAADLTSRAAMVVIWVCQSISFRKENRLVSVVTAIAAVVSIITLIVEIV